MSGPYVVIEGPSGSGKTTLARAISGATIDRRPYPDALHEDYLRILHRGDRGPVVLDGFHLADEIRRRGPSGFDRWQVEGALMARDALLLYCRPVDAPEEWDRLVESVDLPRYVYDRSQPGSFSRTRAVAEAWIRSHDGRGRLFGPGVVGLGNLRNPRTVYVGEQPVLRDRWRRRALKLGREPERYVRLAARLSGSYPGVFDSDSGRYLWAALEGIRLADYGVINAVQLDGSRLRDHLRGDPGEVRWVALGRIAEEELRACGIVGEAIPHPSYWRRFRYARLAEYREMILGRTVGGDL